MSGFFPAPNKLPTDGFFGGSAAPPPGWTAQNPGSLFGVYGAAGGNGRFVVMDGTGGPSYSTDFGVSWTSSGTFLGVSFGTGAFYQNGVFVVFCDNGITGAVYTSRSIDGGVTWSAPVQLRNNVGMQRAGSFIIGDGSNTMVAVLSSDAPSYFVSTNNGVSWTPETTFTGTLGANSVTQNQAVFFASQFVAPGRLTTTATRILTSPDGITWSVGATLATGNPVSVAAGLGLYLVSLGNDATVLSASTIAGLQSATPVDTGLGGFLVAVFFDGSTFFAFNSAGAGASSTDCQTWTAETTHLSIADGPFSLAVAGSTLIAIDGDLNSVSTRTPL